LIKFHSFKLDSNFTISTVSSLDFNFDEIFVGISLDCFIFLEVDGTWLIVINNSNSSFGVLSNKLFLGCGIVELDEEILIWLPRVIVFDLNFDELLFLSFFEFKNFINFLVIFSFFSFSINSAYSNASCLA